MIAVRRQRPDAGLSLIEVIVALVIISGFGAALFVWSAQTLQTAARATEVEQRAEIERNITEIAFSLNPAERPSGELLTPTHRYAWSASAVRDLTDEVRLLAGAGPYQVAIYKVRFTVTDRASPAQPWTSEREVGGYRLVRPLQSGPPGFVPAGVPR